MVASLSTSKKPSSSILYQLQSFKVSHADTKIKCFAIAESGGHKNVDGLFEMCRGKE